MSHFQQYFLWLTFPSLTRIMFCQSLTLSVEQLQQPGHSYGEKVPRLGSYLCKTSPTTSQEAGMTFCFVLVNPPHQFSEKSSPSSICTKQHKFLAKSSNFSIGPEVHLKAWHLLLRIFEEAGFSNPHLNTTEKSVSFFFIVPHAVYFLFGKLPKSVSAGCYFAPRDQNQSINPWLGGVRRED